MTVKMASTKKEKKPRRHLVKKQGIRNFTDKSKLDIRQGFSLMIGAEFQKKSSISSAKKNFFFFIFSAKFV